MNYLSQIEVFDLRFSQEKYAQYKVCWMQTFQISSLNLWGSGGITKYPFHTGKRRQKMVNDANHKDYRFTVNISLYSQVIKGYIGFYKT